MKVFSGSSNPKLAQIIARCLNLELGKIQLTKFANSETRVWIKEQVKEEKTIIVQSFSRPPNKHIIELCLIVDALKRMGTRKIIAVIPWLGYCIQDKVFRPGEPLSSKVIAKIVNCLEINHIITLDIHNETVIGFFDIPFTNLSSNSVFKKHFQITKKHFDWIVSPDVGGYKKASGFAKSLNLPLTTINKERNLTTGKVTIIKANNQVKGKSALIVDDFVSTGSTLIETAKFLKENGVKNISAAITHHFYAKGVQEKIEKGPLDMLYVTDTIRPGAPNYRKLEIITVADLITKKIKETVK